MENYLLKMILCSAVLIALYYVFLEKERSFRFNRFYLLFALVFSYMVPLITFTLPQAKKIQTGLVFQESSSTIITSQKITENGFEWLLILVCIYGVVGTLILSKSAYSVFRILKLKGKSIKIDGQKIKVLEDPVSPFSFFGTLYLGENYFKNNQIDERIFIHERNHIQQKHSLDLLLIEILKIVSWFNPALYFYKKAIITNHEFLADENVLQKNFEIKSYQELILKEISTDQGYSFTNQFNFNNTKKRFIMMTKTTSKYAAAKKIFALPVFGILVFLFASKVYSKETESPVKVKSQLVEIKENNPEFISLRTEVYKMDNDTIKKPKNIQPKKIEKSLLVAETELAPPPPPPPPSVTEQTPAEFPGGANAFRTAVLSVFDTSLLDGDEKFIQTVVFFRINEDGNVIEYFKTEGNNDKFNAEAVRAIKKANEGKIWKPATQDGKAVSSVYRMPLTMTFAK